MARRRNDSVIVVSLIASHRDIHVCAQLEALFGCESGRVRILHKTWGPIRRPGGILSFIPREECVAMAHCRGIDVLSMRKDVHVR